MTQSHSGGRKTAGQKEFIALMAVMMSVVAISIDAMLPALGIIGRDLGVSHPNHAQYILSLIFAGMAIGQLINGPLSDAYGRKRVLYFGLGLYLIGSVICLNATTLSTMLTGRFIQGLGVSGPYISIMSIVRDRYSGREMARIMSLVMTIFIMVPVIAPALGQGILFLASWHSIFVLYIFYALLVGVWVYFRLEETLPPEKRMPYTFGSVWNGARTVLTHRVTLTYTLALGAIFGALLGDLSTVQQVFHEKYHVGNMFAVYFGLQALAFGAASFTNSRLVERLGMRYLSLLATAGIVLASLAFFAFSAVVGTPFWLYFFYGVLLLFSVGLLFGNLNALAMEPMGEIAGIASAIIGAVSSVIGIAFGAIIGQLYEGSLTPIVLGFLLLGSLTFAIIFYERSHLPKAATA